MHVDSEVGVVARTCRGARVEREVLRGADGEHADAGQELLKRDEAHAEGGLVVVEVHDGRSARFAGGDMHEAHAAAPVAGLRGVQRLQVVLERLDVFCELAVWREVRRLAQRRRDLLQDGYFVRACRVGGVNPGGV